MISKKEARVKESEYIDCMYDFFRLPQKFQEPDTRGIKVKNVREISGFCVSFEDEDGETYWMFAYAHPRYSNFSETIKNAEGNDVTVSLFPNRTGADNFVLRVE